MIDQNTGTTQLHFTNLCTDCSSSVGRVLAKPFADAIEDADAPQLKKRLKLKQNYQRRSRRALRVRPTSRGFGWESRQGLTRVHAI